MTSPLSDQGLREAILARPNLILEDSDVMNALIAADDRSVGENVIDLRGIALNRLETRLDRLEDTHRTVIAAAYENVAGTQQIQRAVLSLMEAETLDDLLDRLGGEVAEILRLDAVRLLIEAEPDDRFPDILADHAVACLRVPGFIERYLGQSAHRRVTLRQHTGDGGSLFGPDGDEIGSEACLALDPGPGAMRGLLVFGAADPQMFAPHQGTDLLRFFADATERLMVRLIP